MQIELGPEHLEVLAKFLDGFDDNAAAEARRMAEGIRRGLLSCVVTIDGKEEEMDQRRH
jgi:hypothetical protein